MNMTNNRCRRLKREVPHVALIVETSTVFGRGILRGISHYVRENGPWSIYLEQRSIYDPAPRWLKKWAGDGIISRAAYPELARLVLSLGIPTVDLQEQVLGLDLPRIINDNEAVGRMAAEHFLERGFMHFGFLGHTEIGWSEGRRAGFAKTLEAAGYRCDEFKSGRARRRYHQRSWEQEQDHVAAWLLGLPKPAGVLACNDFRAVQLLDACRRAGVAVPEQVAVLGVDNEEFACEMSNPPLSSVATNPLHIGYEAASLLDRLMRGGKIYDRRIMVPPMGVVIRRSTDVGAISDPIVADAVQFIRQNACKGINIEDILEHLAVSRSVLQRRFRLELNKTIHEVIFKTRVERVKELLATTSLSREKIAHRTGFRHPEYMSAAFKEHTGGTLREFRKNL
jgi:LacI family transcriptional regulator